MTFKKLFNTYDAVEPPPYRTLKKYNITQDPFNLPWNELEYPSIMEPSLPTLDETTYDGITAPSRDRPTFNFDVGITPVKSKTNSIVDTARQFLGLPYVYGGHSPLKGFDCSGLLSYVYSLNGIDIGYTTYDIFKAGIEVPSLQDAKVGDIICTPGSGLTRRHVKMISLIVDGQIYVIEAKGKKWGIIEHPLEKTNNITSIRRVIGNNLPTQSLSTQSTVSSNNGKFNNLKEFVSTLNSEYQKALKEKGLDPSYSQILVSQDALESGWGTKLVGSYNYGGIKSKTGTLKDSYEYINGVKTPVQSTFRNFNSISDYCNYKINLFLNKRYNAFNYTDASNPSEFIRHINDSGYSTTPSDTYVSSIMKIYNKISNILS